MVDALFQYMRSNLPSNVLLLKQYYYVDTSVNKSFDKEENLYGM